MQLQTQNPDGSFSSVEAGYNDVNGSDLQSDQVKAQSDFANGPLASLFKPKYNYNAIQYPSDLNSSGKGHSIVFEIFQPQSASAEELASTITNGLDKAKNSAVSAWESGTTALSNGANALITNPADSAKAVAAAADSPGPLIYVRRRRPRKSGVGR